MILDSSFRRRQGAITDSEDAVADDVALLLGDYSANAGGPDAGDCLKTIVSARDSRGDETRNGGLKSDVPELDALNELPSFALVIDGDVV